MPVPTVSTASSNGGRTALPGIGSAYSIDGGGVSGYCEIVPNSISDASVNQSLANTAQYNLTSANILGMFATPVTILPAITGATIIVDYILFRMISTATAYAGGGTVTIAYNGGSAVVNTFSAALITTTSTTANTVLVTGATNITALANTGITITNASGAFTTGTGVAQIYISYIAV